MNKCSLPVIVQRHRKDFLIGGAQFETTHRVVSNLNNNLRNLGGHMPLVPPPVPTPMLFEPEGVVNLLFYQGHRKMFLIRGAGLVNVLREAQLCGRSPNWLGGSGGMPPPPPLENFRKTDALRLILVQSEPICSTLY